MVAMCVAAYQTKRNIQFFLSDHKLHRAQKEIKTMVHLEKLDEQLYFLIRQIWRIHEYPVVLHTCFYNLKYIIMFGNKMSAVRN